MTKDIFKKWWFWFALVWIIGVIGIAIFPDTKTNSLNTKQELIESIFTEDGSFKLDSTRGTNEAELEIYKKAKEDCEIFQEDDIPKIIEFISSNIDDPWINESLMEQFIYLGTIVDKSPYSSEKEKSIGYKAKSIVSFVYRGHETVEESQFERETLIKRLNEYNN